jgi:hypothetical protein
LTVNGEAGLLGVAVLKCVDPEQKLELDELRLRQREENGVLVHLQKAMFAIQQHAGIRWLCYVRLGKVR